MSNFKVEVILKKMVPNMKHVTIFVTTFVSPELQMYILTARAGAELVV